jgi:hypothetical protein
MGGATPASDWDFITKTTDAVRAWLTAQGFTEHDVTAEQYRDTVTDAVYKRTTPEGEVQVQLCADPVRKYRAAQFIKTHRFREHYTAQGPERSAMWRAAYEESAP